jgi:hypothetical protein
MAASKCGESLKRIREKFGLTPLFVSLTLVLIRAFDEVTKILLPSSWYDLPVVALCVLLSLLLAAAFSRLSKKLLLKARLSFLGRHDATARPRIHSVASFLAYLVATAFTIVFIGSHTVIWHIASSWWNGPQIDLTSRVPEQTFQPIVNLPWFNYGQDFGHVSPWSWVGASRNRAVIEQTFDRLSEGGVRCVLWFLLCDGRSLEIDPNGYVIGVGSKFFEDYDAALEIARKYRVGIIWVVIDHYFMHPAKEDKGASLFGNADIIEQSDKRQSFLNNALRPILRRYPYESQIAGWVLINEPENAIKQGYVSSGAIGEFTHEAATLIKQSTHRQPVSIACTDLESLIEYSGKYAADVDFFIFHHYEQFLPPPVSRVRELMAGGNDKPIYIGEFDIDDPPVSIPQLVRWVPTLGYAGVWPWSANPEANRSPKQPAQSSIGQNVTAVSEMITAGNDTASLLRREFERNRRAIRDALTPSFDDDLNWWIQHWSTIVMPEVVKNKNQWVSDATLENAKHEENSLWESDKLQWQDVLAKRKAEKQMELDYAEKILRENESVNDVNGAANSRKWVERIKGELKKIEAEIRSQEKDLQTARQRIALHQSLSNYYRYRLKWAEALYEKFWEAEKAAYEEGIRR